MLSRPTQIAAVAVILWGAILALFHTAFHPRAVAAQTNGPETVRSELLPAQQFVYVGQATLASGERAAIFIPNHPVGLAVQVRSGPRAMILGDIVSCRPFTETEPIGDRKSSMQLLNCGALSRGEQDRIFAVVALQWQ